MTDTPNRPDSPMRIAIVVPPGGLFCAHQPNSMETVIRTLSRHVSAGEDVRIFCTQGALAHDCPLPVIATAPGDHAAQLEALKAFDPQLIEYHQHVLEAIRIARHFPKAVSVVYRHNALKSAKSAFSRWRYSQRYKKIDHFVFVSQSEKRIFMRDFPGLVDRAHVIANPIDVRPWHAEVSERQRQIVFSGRAMKEKGVAEVCAALPAVLDAHPDWKAVLLLNDWDSHKDWAAPHVEPLHVYADRVRILHSVPLAEVQAIMKASDIALTPSLWEEPLGLTALEAHASGVALISSGRGGLREASGEHALYVEPVTAQTLSSAISQLIENPQQRLDMARAAQAQTVSLHSPEARSRELSSLRRLFLGHDHKI